MLTPREQGKLKAGMAVDTLIDELGAYADAHRMMYDSDLSEDCVLGESFLCALRGVRGLLNGELGVCDGATLAGRILAAAELAGFEEEEI